MKELALDLVASMMLTLKKRSWSRGTGSHNSQLKCII